MRARFQSKCPRCHKAIHEGDEILKRNGDQQYSHATCPVEYEVKVEAGSIAPNKGAMDYDTLSHQLYDKNPFLDLIDSKVERMEKLYGKRVTIPMNASTDTTKDQIKGLRREADRLEAVAKRHKREAKARRKAAKVEARRIEAAKATLEAIATDRKARKEDRVEAARILLDRGI